MPLMDRIKCTSFLDMTPEQQSALVRSIQLIRNKSLKEASQKKVRKTSEKKTKENQSKTTKIKKVSKKVTAHIDELNQAELLKLAEKYGIKL